MELSDIAKADLKNILFKEFREKSLDFSDMEINEIGTMLLNLAALSLKRKLCAHSKDDLKK